MAAGLAALLLSVAANRSHAEDNPPRALIALFETARITLPQGPLPNGLRFALYDDGTVITRSDPKPDDPDPAGRGVVFGVIDRDAAENLRRDAVADLQEAKPQSGHPSLADVGSTVLEVWDGERYRRFGASIWPCRAAGKAFASRVEQRNRDETDPRLLKVCDRLRQYQIAEPQAWRPKAVELRIGVMEDPPERQVPWPKEWPAAPSDLKPKAAVAFCAPVSSDPDAFSHGLIGARWGETGRTALVIDQSTSAVIWDWYFDLPAAIPLVNEKGEPDGTVGDKCREAAAP